MNEASITLSLKQLKGDPLAHRVTYSVDKTPSAGGQEKKKKAMVAMTIEKTKIMTFGSKDINR